MTYNPAATPIVERILANVVATLTAIQPPTYATAVKRVRQWDGNPFTPTDYPAIAVVEGVEKQNDRHSLVVDYTLPITLVIGVFDADWKTKLKKLAADLQVALLADHTRGGFAMDTKILETEVFDNVPSEPVGAAQMELVVRFRTVSHDPNSLPGFP